MWMTDEESADNKEQQIGPYTEHQINEAMKKFGTRGTIEHSAIADAIKAESYCDVAAIVRKKPRFLTAGYPHAYWLVSRQSPYTKLSDARVIAILRFFSDLGLRLDFPGFHTETRGSGEHQQTVYVPDHLPFKVAIDRSAKGQGDALYDFFCEDFRERVSKSEPMLLRKLITNLASDAAKSSGDVLSRYTVILKNLLDGLKGDLGDSRVSDILSRKMLSTVSSLTELEMELFYSPVEDISEVIQKDAATVFSCLIDAGIDLRNIFGGSCGAHLALQHNSVNVLKLMARKGINIAAGTSAFHDFNLILPATYTMFLSGLSALPIAFKNTRIAYQEFGDDLRDLSRSGNTSAYFRTLFNSAVFFIPTLINCAVGLLNFVLAPAIFVACLFIYTLAVSIKGLVLTLTCKSAFCQRIPENEAAAFLAEWKQQKRAKALESQSELEKFVDAWGPLRVRVLPFGSEEESCEDDERVTVSSIELVS